MTFIPGFSIWAALLLSLFVASPARSQQSQFAFDFEDGAIPASWRVPFDQLWSPSTRQASSGSYSLSALSFDRDNEIVLEFFVEVVPGTLTFDVLVSPPGRLFIAIDGDVQQFFTNTNGWQEVDVELKAGLRTIAFEFETSIPGELAEGYIDNVRYQSVLGPHTLEVAPRAMVTPVAGDMPQNSETLIADVLAGPAPEFLTSVDPRGAGLWYVAVPRPDGSLAQVWVSPPSVPIGSGIAGEKIRSLRVFEHQGGRFVASLGGYREVRVYRIPGLQLERQFTLGVNALQMEVADVDADGQLEIVALYGDTFNDCGCRLRTWDYTTLARKPSVNTFQTINGFALGQLDADPALEYMISSGSQGRVIDGATLLEDWSYRGGAFGEFLKAGNMDSDPTQEFLASSASGINAFNASPYLLQGEISGSQQAEIADVNGDGAGEILVRNRLNQSVDVYLFPGPTPFFELRGEHGDVSGVAAGDIDADGSTDIVWTSAGSLTTNSGAVVRGDATTRSVVWQSGLPEAGYPTRFRVADIDADGDDDLIGYHAQYLHRLDPDTLEPTAAGGITTDRAGTAFDIAQLDADPALELVSADGTTLHVMDSLTGLDEATFNFDLITGTPVRSAPVRSMNVFGDRKVAVAFNNLVVGILDLDTGLGAPIEIAPDEGTGVSAWAPPGSAVGPALILTEPILAALSRVWIVDVEDETTESFEVTGSINSMTYVPARNEILVGRSDGLVEFYNAATRMKVDDLRFNDQPEALAFLTAGGRDFVVASVEGHLKARERSTGSLAFDAGFVATDLGVDATFTVRGQAGRFELLAASSAGLHAFDITFLESPLFRDGFE